MFTYSRLSGSCANFVSFYWLRGRRIPLKEETSKWLSFVTERWRVSGWGARVCVWKVNSGQSGQKWRSVAAVVAAVRLTLTTQHCAPCPLAGAAEITTAGRRFDHFVRVSQDLISLCRLIARNIGPGLSLSVLLSPALSRSLSTGRRSRKTIDVLGKAVEWVLSFPKI